MIVILIIIAALLAANIVVSWLNADTIATAIYASKDIPIMPPKPVFKHDKPIKETEEQRRQRILNENIENYDGSPKGQIKL
jgi:hypothetical protein